MKYTCKNLKPCLKPDLLFVTLLSLWRHGEGRYVLPELPVLRTPTLGARKCIPVRPCLLELVLHLMAWIKALIAFMCCAATYLMGSNIEAVRATVWPLPLTL